MSWPALSIAFFVSHLVGDFLFQTEWQAANKTGGLARAPASRRALGAHALTYTCAFVPALVWFASERSVLGALAVAVAITAPHVAIDHGRAVPLWMRHVKKNPVPLPAALPIIVDQTMHVVCMFAVALIAAA